MKPATMLMHRAALNRDVGPQFGKGFLEAGRAVDNGEWSLQDSNGDGIGGLDGIRQRLDYLVWLGVDAI